MGEGRAGLGMRGGRDQLTGRGWGYRGGSLRGVSRAVFTDQLTHTAWTSVGGFRMPKRGRWPRGVAQTRLTGQLEGTIGEHW